MTSPIRFSFIVSCYNLEKYIGVCLYSLLRQNYPADDFEIICIDDGSEDSSYETILKIAKGHSNIRFFKTENSGLERTCNRAIGLSQNDLIVRVDADDILDREYLSVMNRAIQSRPQYDFYYCQDYVEYYSESRQQAKSVPAFDGEEIFSRGDFFATATVYRKEQLKAIGFFPDTIKNCGLENYHVILKLISSGKRGLAVPEASFYYRRHLTNMSTVKQQAIIDYGHKLLAQYGRKFQTNEFHPYGLRLNENAGMQKKRNLLRK